MITVRYQVSPHFQRDSNEQRVEQEAHEEERVGQQQHERPDVEHEGRYSGKVSMAEASDGRY